MSTVEELQSQLRIEQAKNLELVKKCEKLSTAHGNLQNLVEQEEDAITNKLTKRLQELQDEKKKLALLLDSEVC